MVISWRGVVSPPSYLPLVGVGCRILIMGSPCSGLEVSAQGLLKW